MRKAKLSFLVMTDIASLYFWLGGVRKDARVCGRLLAHCTVPSKTIPCPREPRCPSPTAPNTLYLLAPNGIANHEDFPLPYSGLAVANETKVVAELLQRKEPHASLGNAIAVLLKEVRGGQAGQGCHLSKTLHLSGPQSATPAHEGCRILFLLHLSGIPPPFHLRHIQSCIRLL